MADAFPSSNTRPCAMCGLVFKLNPNYSAKQRQRASYCSRQCAGRAQPHTRIAMIDLLGGQTRFGKLTFVDECEAKGLMRRGRFRCDCGNERAMGLHHIRNGKTVSCGCESAKRSASRFTKHGAYRTAEYRSWNAMMQRCHNPNSTSWPDYGGRGISVCEQWHGPIGFNRFLAYVGPRPKGHSIERIDNAKGYMPGNVRWATQKEQMNNRRVSKLISFNGLTLNARDWASKLGMGKNTIDARLKAGWSIERALTTPAAMSGGRVTNARKAA